MRPSSFLVLAVLLVLGMLVGQAAVSGGEWTVARLGLGWVEERLSGATWVLTGSSSGATGRA